MAGGGRSDADQSCANRTRVDWKTHIISVPCDTQGQKFRPFTVMARLYRAIGINTMLWAMAQSSRAMTNALQRAMTSALQRAMTSALQRSRLSAPGIRAIHISARGDRRNRALPYRLPRGSSLTAMKPCRRRSNSNMRVFRSSADNGASAARIGVALESIAFSTIARPLDVRFAIRFL